MIEPPKTTSQSPAAALTSPKKAKSTSLANKEIQLFKSKNPNKIRPFPQKELIKFYRGVASMLRAQINTADALKYYAEGLPNKQMANSLLEIRNQINAGVSIHQAFKSVKRFDQMTLGLVKAGVESGQLYEAFGDLAERAAIQIAFKKKIRKATLIPSIVMPTLIGLFIYSQVKIIPQIKQMVSSGGQNIELGGLVKFFFDMSDAVIQYWPPFVLILIAIVAIIAFSKKLKAAITGIAMSRWTLLRKLIMSLRQMTFLGVIRLLNDNGINLSKSIRTGATSVSGTPFHDELNEAADKYEKSGVPLSTAFAKYTSVDDQVVHMFSIGEKSASMGVQLKMLTRMYEDDCDQLMEDFTNIVSFIVLLIAVSLVALVFISTFMPVFLMGPEMMKQAL